MVGTSNLGYVTWPLKNNTVRSIGEKNEVQIKTKLLINLMLTMMKEIRRDIAKGRTLMNESQNLSLCNATRSV